MFLAFSQESTHLWDRNKEPRFVGFAKNILRIFTQPYARAMKTKPFLKSTASLNGTH